MVKSLSYISCLRKKRIEDVGAVWLFRALVLRDLEMKKVVGWL